MMKPALSKARYTPSSSITVSSNGQLVEGLDIVATGSYGITTNSKTGGIIRKNRIFYGAGQRGIRVDGNGWEVSDNQIFYTGAPNPFGCAPSESEQPIFIINIQTAQILRNKICGGNGLKIQGSEAANLGDILIQYLECNRMRGTFDTQGYGGGISLDACDKVQLLDGYIKNDLAISWTGDNINVDNSAAPSTKGHHQIARWVIDGSNCTNGAGVQLQSTIGCSVTDCDALNMGNQGFVTAGGTNNTFTTCRVKSMYDPCTQGRGHSTAGGLGVCFAVLDWSGTHSTGIVWTTSGYDQAGRGVASDYYADPSSGVTGTPASNLGAFTVRTPYLWIPDYV